MPLNKINYTALISKALYFSKREIKKKAKGRQSKNSKKGAMSALSEDSADLMRKMVTMNECGDSSQLSGGTQGLISIKKGYTVVEDTQTMTEGGLSDTGDLFSTLSND